MSQQDKATDDKPKSGSILDFQNAASYCQDQVKKYDFYSYHVGQAFPKNLQPYYYGIHALFLEALKSREISREQSVC